MNYIGIDIFISCRISDLNIAKKIAELAANLGMTTYSVENISPGQDYANELRKAIEECRVVVVILGTEALGSNSLFEIGAATSLNKDILCVNNGTNPIVLPGFLNGRKLFSVTQLDELILHIKRNYVPLNESESNELLRIFNTANSKVDNLLSNKAKLNTLSTKLESKTHKKLQPERIYSELVRMKNAGLITEATNQ